jgi:hypothetical protein
MGKNPYHAHRRFPTVFLVYILACTKLVLMKQHLYVEPLIQFDANILHYAFYPSKAIIYYNQVQLLKLRILRVLGLSPGV